jgi:hypothetical protein
MNSWFHEMREMFWLGDLLPVSQIELGRAIAQADSYCLQNLVTRIQF